MAKVFVKKIIAAPKPAPLPEPEPEIEPEVESEIEVEKEETPTERLARLQKEFQAELGKKADPQFDASAPPPSREPKTEWQSEIAKKFASAKVRFTGAKEIFVDDDKKDFHLHVIQNMLYYSISTQFSEAVVEMHGVRRDKLIAAVDYTCLGKKFF